RHHQPAGGPDRGIDPDHGDLGRCRRVQPGPASVPDAAVRRTGLRRLRTGVQRRPVADHHRPTAGAAGDADRDRAAVRDQRDLGLGGRTARPRTATGQGVPARALTALLGHAGRHARPCRPLRCSVMSGAPQAVLINGTVGSGKTTVAGALADLLRNDDVPGAAIDLDWLAEFWPSPPDDRFNTALTLTNLRAVAANFRAAGARVLIMAGVVETTDERRRVAEAVDCPLALVRLTADLELIRRRLHRRHDLDPDGLRWHLDR